MKKFFIVHGWEGHPNEKQLLWLRNKLIEAGHEAFNLEMPNTEEPEIKAWVDHIAESVGKIDENTFLIGHSIGGQAILRFTEKLREGSEIGGLIMVAPWMELDEATLEEEGEEVREIARPWMETPIDFEKIKKISKTNMAFFSSNDPYVDSKQAKIFSEKLNAKIFILENRGHFNESGVTELPEILEEINKALTTSNL